MLFRRQAALTAKTLASSTRAGLARYVSARSVDSKRSAQDMRARRRRKEYRFELHFERAGRRTDSNLHFELHLVSAGRRAGLIPQFELRFESAGECHR